MAARVLTHPDQILVHYMQKATQDYVTAVNGLEALQKFQVDPLAFKVIFMGMGLYFHPPLSITVGSTSGATQLLACNSVVVDC